MILCTNTNLTKDEDVTFNNVHILSLLNEENDSYKVRLQHVDSWNK